MALTSDTCVVSVSGGDVYLMLDKNDENWRYQDVDVLVTCSYTKDTDTILQFKQHFSGSNAFYTLSERNASDGTIDVLSYILDATGDYQFTIPSVNKQADKIAVRVISLSTGDLLLNMYENIIK